MWPPDAPLQDGVDAFIELRTCFHKDRLLANPHSCHHAHPGTMLMRMRPQTMVWIELLVEGARCWALCDEPAVHSSL